MKKYIEQNGITYELRGEQYYPLLELPEQKEIGKYGRVHLDYIKSHRRGRYTTLLTEGKLVVLGEKSPSITTKSSTTQTLDENGVAWH